jgi:hypothetical protein
MVLNIKHQTAYSQSLVEFVLLVFFNFLYCVVFVFSRLSIVDCPFGFLSFLYSVLFVFVICAVSPVSLDCPLLIVPSVLLVFYIVFCLFSSCVLCFQFIWIVHCWLSLRFSLTFIYHKHTVFFYLLLLLNCLRMPSIVAVSVYQ